MVRPGSTQSSLPSPFVAHPLLRLWHLALHAVIHGAVCFGDGSKKGFFSDSWDASVIRSVSRPWCCGGVFTSNVDVTEGAGTRPRVRWRGVGRRAGTCGTQPVPSEVEGWKGVVLSGVLGMGGRPAYREQLDLYTVSLPGPSYRFHGSPPRGACLPDEASAKAGAGAFLPPFGSQHSRIRKSTGPDESGPALGNETPTHTLAN